MKYFNNAEEAEQWRAGSVTIMTKLMALMTKRLTNNEWITEAMKPFDQFVNDFRKAIKCYRQQAEERLKAGEIPHSEYKEVMARCDEQWKVLVKFLETDSKHRHWLDTMFHGSTSGFVESLGWLEARIARIAAGYAQRDKPTWLSSELLSVEREIREQEEADIKARNIVKYIVASAKIMSETHSAYIFNGAYLYKDEPV